MPVEYDRSHKMVQQLYSRGYGCLQTEGWIIEKILGEGERPVGGDPSDWSDCLLDNVKVYYGPAWHNPALTKWNLMSINLEQTFTGSWAILQEVTDCEAAKIYDCNECKHKFTCLVDKSVEIAYESSADSS